MTRPISRHLDDTFTVGESTQLPSLGSKGSVNLGFVGRNGGAREREGRRAGRGGGKVDGGADRTTRELEGPKETTRVEPRRWPREKEQTKWKRDERRTAAE